MHVFGCPVVCAGCWQFVAINWIAVFRSCFLVMFLAYPGVSLKVLQVFQCRDINGVAYLEADMRLKVRGRELDARMSATRRPLSPREVGAVRALLHGRACCVCTELLAPQCFTSEWVGYAVYSLIIVVVYVIGLPLGMS